MAVYDIIGTELSALYDMDGSVLSVAYDLSGEVIFETGGGSDYDQYDTEYQHTILIARDAWKTEYRADNTVIPLIVHTDQHRYLNNANKPTFDYLAKAVRWDEASAIVGLGDVCGAVYGVTDLSNMLNCLSSIAKSSQINIAGNHDTQLNKEEGSSYAYAPLTDELFHVLQNTYFDNSAYGQNVRYGFKGMESVVDESHNVKYCIFAVWYTRGNPWYKYYLTAEAVDAMIAMLSDGVHDLVVLSHIQPYGKRSTWIAPAVDGSEQSIVTGTRAHIAYTNEYAIDQLLADRQAKRSGTITDCDGVAHNYDFSNCSSDLLCCLNGHSHADRIGYSPDNTVPSVTFDAYRYDNVPMYFVNINRTLKRLNIWKFDEGNNIYNFQVPFEEVTI